MLSLQCQSRRQRDRQTTRRPLVFQPLESKTPLAGDIVVNYAAGEVTINGGLGNDEALVQEIVDSVTQIELLRITIQDHELVQTSTVVKDAIHTIKFNGSWGNDRFQYLGNSTAGPTVHANGGPGRDHLQGSARMDFLSGGAGDDDIFGLGGADVLRGGSGSDYLAGHEGNDYIEGGPGPDTILGQNGKDTIWGDGGDDRIWGHNGSDTIRGGGGDDRLFGGNQNDQIWGGVGNDMLAGERGWDLLYGGSDSDRIHGGDGNDKLYGNSGDDFLYGGGGNDQLRGHGGIDRLFGGSDNDWLNGGHDGKRDRLQGNSGRDKFVADCQNGTNLDAPLDARPTDNDLIIGDCTTNSRTHQPRLQRPATPLPNLWHLDDDDDLSEDNGEISHRCQSFAKTNGHLTR